MSGTEISLTNKKINVIKWPAQSPDLNPIKNLLAELNRIAQERKAKNEAELFDELKRYLMSLNVEGRQYCYMENTPRFSTPRHVSKRILPWKKYSHRYHNLYIY